MVPGGALVHTPAHLTCWPGLWPVGNIPRSSASITHVRSLPRLPGGWCGDVFSYWFVLSPVGARKPFFPSCLLTPISCVSSSCLIASCPLNEEAASPHRSRCSKYKHTDDRHGHIWAHTHTHKLTHMKLDETTQLK